MVGATRCTDRLPDGFLQIRTGIVTRFQRASVACLILCMATALPGAFIPALGQAPGGRVTPVEAAKVSVEPVVETLHAVGSLQANRSVIVRPEIAGVIEEIQFEETARVEKGQPLFALDDTILRAELAQSEAALRLSQRNAERANELFERKAGTGRAVDEARSNLEADRAAVALSRARLEKTKILAPFEGVAGLHSVDQGEYVVAGQDLVSLDDVDPIEIDFNVPERFLRFLNVGQPIRLKVDAMPGQTFDGNVSAISPRADPAGRSLAIRARVPNPDGRLRPGLFAEIDVVVEHRQAAIVVPEQAIVPQGDKLFVFRVVEGKAALTPVKVGLRIYGKVEIVEGLGPEDVVVTAGQLKIRDGVPVKVLDPRGSGGGSAPAGGGKPAGTTSDDKAAGNGTNAQKAAGG